MLNVIIAAAICHTTLPAPSDTTLEGPWRVDLRASPEDPPYYQTFVVETVADDTLTGTFYGSPIREGHINTNWGEVRFAFVTQDGSGEYHTSGVLRDGRLEGLTHSIGRGFVMPWRAIPPYPVVTLSAEEAREEVALLRSAFDQIHPGLHRYATPAEVEEAFVVLDQAIANGVTDLELYHAISVATAVVRCGHTRVETPSRITDYRKRAPTHLPYQFRLLEGRMIVDAVAPGLTELKRGDEVLSINGTAVTTLVEQIAPTVPVDGSTDAIRPSRLDTAYEFRDSGFDHYLPLLYGFRDDFMLVLRDHESGQTRQINVPAITHSQWQDIGDRRPNNFADALRLERVANDTVLLEVGSFINYRNTVDPESTFADLFRQINATGVDHLIVDLRANGGGSGDVPWTLARFLDDRPIEFQPPLVKNYRYSDELRVHLDTWERAALNMPDEAFTKRDDGWFELKPEASGQATRLEPHPDRFDGRVTVLMGPYNASGTTMLLAMLKQRARARLIGEPAGGSADGPTAGVLFTLTLPRSGIRVLVPALREQTPGGPYESGAGVQPDVLVPVTVDDFRAGRDRTLEIALTSADD